ncbi:MAG: hypothetical protein AB8B61_09205 [Cyclobacteriaceae bacterium]
MKAMNIKGKEYVTVNERVKHFRSSETYKGWSINTSIHTINEKECVFLCEIKDSKGAVISTGHAHEVAGSTNVNKTSHVENCETSAIGRALGCLGIGIDASFASYDEVQTAISQQEDLDVIKDNIRDLSKLLPDDKREALLNELHNYSLSKAIACKSKLETLKKAV